MIHKIFFYFLNIFIFCDNGSILTWFLAETDRQKNIKLSDGNTNNSSTLIKTRPFQQKQIYGNWSTHWKIIAEKILKRIFMRPYKKHLTYDHNFVCTNKGYFLQKHIQILWKWINFYVIYSPNKYSDNQTNFELLHNNIINIGTTIKRKLFKNNNNKKLN